MLDLPFISLCFFVFHLITLPLLLASDPLGSYQDELGKLIGDGAAVRIVVSALGGAGLS
jgi:hypothetical protein